MALSLPYHGKTGEARFSISGTTVPAIVTLTNWSIDASTDTDDITSLGDTNKRYVLGIPDFKVSFAGVWDAADDSLFTAAASSDGCLIRLYPTTLARGKYWAGPVFVTGISLTVDKGGAVKISGSAMAAGNITRS